MSELTRSLAVRILSLALALGLAPGPSVSAEVSLGWRSERTFVFAVGVLEWLDRDDWASFPRAGRCDAALVALLREKGVPAEQFVYLQDREATASKIQSRLGALLARTRPGDELIVYYAGHGFVSDGAYYLAPYDCGAGKETWWSAPVLFDRLERDFRGKRAMVLVDCCYSGSVVDLARLPGRRIGYAAFGSSSAREASTENWTFTSALLDAFSGSPLVDLDGDGVIRAIELARHAYDDLQAFDEQRGSSGFTGSFQPETVLARRRGARPHARTGERVKVLYDGKLWPARVLDVKGEKALCHWATIGWHREEDEEWVPLSTLRPLAAAAYPVGGRVEVRWEGKWYAARVLAVEGGVHLVHYDGYDGSWDEWVPSSTIRPGRPRRAPTRGR